MIDLKLLRTNPELFKKDLEKRNMDTKIVDDLLSLDEEWRSLKYKLDSLRKRRNELSREAKYDKNVIEEAKEIKQEIDALEKRIKEVEEARFKLLLKMPNLLDEEVPYGLSDEDNVPIRYVGNPMIYKEDIKGWSYPVEPKLVNFKPKDHIDLLFNKYAETEKAGKIAGARFYYMFDELVELEQALIRFAFDMFKKKGYRIVEPPFMIREEHMHKVLDYDSFEDMVYKIEDEDLVLIGTAEHPLALLHMDEIIDEDELPKAYLGISPCFRKEAGSHGRDTKGIFRVHQFNKIEQFVFAKPEESKEWHEKITRNAEEIYQKLEIPYRVVLISSGDIGSVAAKKYDIEGWLPGQKKYRELVSSSNCTEWQARRINARLRRKNGEIEFLHTLNSTAIALQRTLIAIVENHQKEDGSIEIPKVLHKYLSFKVMEPIS